MEQRFKTSGQNIDLLPLREFIEREGEAVAYRRGDQMEREGDPARWLAYVTEGCFKYINHGVSDDLPHITWFSFEGEFVGDYPMFLYGRPAQTTIEAMIPSRVLRGTGEQMKEFFSRDMEHMEMRAMIGEIILSQFRSRYIDLHCATASERYVQLMQRCPGIVNLLDLQDIASFLNISPQMLSRIRKEISFGAQK